MNQEDPNQGGITPVIEQGQERRPEGSDQLVVPPLDPDDDPYTYPDIDAEMEFYARVKAEDQAREAEARAAAAEARAEAEALARAELERQLAHLQAEVERLRRATAGLAGPTTEG
jgi:hypothetical protein